jgi:phosphoglycolate phosphatase-like HAD superfamily hydrolase
MLLLIASCQLRFFVGGILQGLGLAENFRIIYGGNGVERKKRDPMCIETILREFGACERNGRRRLRN